MSRLKQSMIVLSLGMILLTGCVQVGSEARLIGACPPVREYDREFLDRAADEVEQLPDGSAIEEMLKDYNVMREQARVC